MRALTIVLLTACASDHDATPPVQPDSGVEPPPPTEAIPRTALVTMTSATPAAQTLQVVANTGFRDVVTQVITLAAGDRLRLRGQVEWTNDFPEPVAGVAELTINASRVAPPTTQNNVQLGTHHTVLYQSAVFTAPADGDYTIALRFAANRSGSSPAVTVEASGYSQLVVEHYRTFPSAGAASDAGAYLLRNVAVDRSTTITSYGIPASAFSSIYEIDPQPRRGDLVRLSAQTTSRWSGAQAAVPRDMHGSSIQLRGAATTRISAWATENTPWDVNLTPLWTDAVHVAVDDVRYVATMHGVSGQGNLVEGTQGHLAAMVFSQASTDPAWALVSSDAVVRDADLAHAANSPAVRVASRTLQVGARAIARLEGTVQLAYASGVASPFCRIVLAATDPAGAKLAEAVASKYLTPTLGGIALRTELLLSLADAGDYRVDLDVQCLRSGENTGVRVVGGGGRVIADLFEPVGVQAVQ